MRYSVSCQQQRDEKKACMCVRETARESVRKSERAGERKRRSKREWVLCVCVCFLGVGVSDGMQGGKNTEKRE